MGGTSCLMLQNLLEPIMRWQRARSISKESIFQSRFLQIQIQKLLWMALLWDISLWFLLKTFTQPDYKHTFTVSEKPLKTTFGSPSPNERNKVAGGNGVFVRKEEKSLKPWIVIIVTPPNIACHFNTGHSADDRAIDGLCVPFGRERGSHYRASLP